MKNVARTIQAASVGGSAVSLSLFLTAEYSDITYLIPAGLYFIAIFVAQEVIEPRWMKS